MEVTMEKYRIWSIRLKYAFWFGCAFNVVCLIFNIVRSSYGTLITMLWTLALTGLCLYESRDMARIYRENPDGVIESTSMFEAVLEAEKREQQK